MEHKAMELGYGTPAARREYKAQRKRYEARLKKKKSGKKKAANTPAARGKKNLQTRTGELDKLLKQM